LNYSYNDDSGTAKTGTVSIPYTASLPHLYVGQLMGPLYYCVLNGDGTLSSCVATGAGFTSPTGIAFNGSYAYVADYGSNTVDVCSVGLNGSLSACVATGGSFQNPWQLSINSNTLYATNISGGVTTCTINAADGTLFPCTPSPGSGATGIAVSSSFAYIGASAAAVSVCSIGGGILSGVCTSTSGFLGVDGITLSGGYAYVANQASVTGTVSVCSINNVDGSLSGCAPSTVGGAPADVVIWGPHAYVNDWMGNIYLCSVGAGGALTSCAVSNGGTSFNFGVQIAIH
jgi:6-phosphogluconolactonase (cycloisomerase 2 family)